MSGLHWSAEKDTTKEYAAASMKILILPASNATVAGLEAAAHEAEVFWENGTWVQRYSGDELEVGTPQQLNFDTEAWVSFFKIHIIALGRLAVFCDHNPS